MALPPRGPARGSPSRGGRAYAELQVTTNFSFLRGGSHAEELVATAKALGLSGLAVTDRNTLAGVVRAHAAAKEVGLRLAVGARLDLTAPALVIGAGTLGVKGQGAEEHAGGATAPCGPSFLCLPRDRSAYGRLCQLLTLGQRRAGKGQCTLFLDDLVAHAEGQVLVALPPPDWDWRKTRAPSATAAGEANDAAHYARDFGHRLLTWRRALTQAHGSRTTLYLAASHTYRGDDKQRLAVLDRLAQACGTPLVATGDVLYHAAHRRALQDVLTCVREKCTLDDAGFRLEANAERHLKTPAEMTRLFMGREAAITRTVEILDACRFSIDDLLYEYPDEPVPSGATPQSHLETLAWAGAAERYPRIEFPDGVPAKVRTALVKELGVIAQLQYAPYFLTVHDIVRFARSQGILCQGRGSAANSTVCYCLGITNVNPIEIDLLFDRFITPERKEPPDIDVDFEHERREEVIQYIYRRYGRERAGLAATVISYRGRSAVREVGKAFGLSQDTVAALAGMVWGSHAGDSLPERHVREAGLDPGEPRLGRVLELSRELMGFPRHLSQHVGGFVLTRSLLSQVVPIGNAAMVDRTCIEWDKDDLDAAGLLKVDVLGLGMLSCIHRAFDLLALHYERPLTLATVPREDPATYDMLCRADSLGVFQVESRAQMNMLPRLKPRNFYDLVIEVAIVRPGPIQGDMVHPYLRRRDGLEPEHYPSPDPRFGPHDELRQILGKTKGVPLFQEQAMRIAMEAAKFTADEVNQLRKAMATFRRRGTIGLLEEKMISAMAARGYDRAFAERCFNQIKGFGEYGFPESHAASFAHLVYVSSWLKCHYPDVFAAALLNSQPMGFYAPAQIVRDAQEHGVEVRGVDVNCSDWDCTLEEGRGNRLQRTGKMLEKAEVGHEEAGNGKRELVKQRQSVTSLSNLFPATCSLRLGLRQIDGLREDEARKIMAARGSPSPRVREEGKGEGQQHPIEHDVAPVRREAKPFRSVQDLWARAGIQLATLERLAAADAFRSLGLDRRQALWEVKALGAARPLPLFEQITLSPRMRGESWGEGRQTTPMQAAALPPRHSPKTSPNPLSANDGKREEEATLHAPPDLIAEPSVTLPAMPLSEHVVVDYQTTRLSLKAHPMSFLRQRLDEMHAWRCTDLAGLKDGARVTVAGIILVRQRPGSAKGVVFMTIEDETGIANAVIWPKTLERYRKVVMGARLVSITGRIQRHESIIHVVAQRLDDRSSWLSLLSEDDGAAMPVPIANADEVRRPEPGSARSSVDQHAAARRPDVHDLRRHPRDVRIIPKSRDFH